MSRVLVTGAAGFLGSRVLTLLQRSGHDAVGTARSAKALHGESTPLIPVDLASPAAPSVLLAEGSYDAVVHCAAHISSGNAPADLEHALASNVAATARLATALAQAGTKRFVFCSTTNIYGDLDPAATPQSGAIESAPARPANAYSWSKLASEQHLALLAGMTAMHTVCLRLAGIHGPGRNAGVVHHMTRNALSGEPLNVNEPESRFSLLFVNDAAEAARLALEMDLDGGFGLWNVAPDEPVTLGALAKRMVELTGSSSAVQIADAGRNRFQVYDNRAFRRASGFAPQSLNVRLRECVDHLRRVIP